MQEAEEQFCDWVGLSPFAVYALQYCYLAPHGSVPKLHLQDPHVPRRKRIIMAAPALETGSLGANSRNAAPTARLSPVMQRKRKTPPPLLRSRTDVNLALSGSSRPRYGLLDWIKLCRSGKDLTGVGGNKLNVTEEELARHNTPEDAWTAIRGGRFFFLLRSDVTSRL